MAFYLTQRPNVHPLNVPLRWGLGNDRPMARSRRRLVWDGRDVSLRSPFII